MSDFLRVLLSVCGLYVLAATAAVADDLAAPAYAPMNAEFTRGMQLYETGRYEKAVAAFEKAAAVDPEDDRYAYWLGKACGRVAERAGPLSALKWAGRTRDALERAVELNPDNRDAVSSLADYYEQAPGFLGGDAAKARELRARLAALPAAPSLDAAAH
ncbi:MAG: tetratricopeptide repeat protein [Gammaproteobacteria bacterium]